jgi:hypothetical protein
VKLPSSEQIPGELFQAGGGTLVTANHKLITLISNKDKLPEKREREREVGGSERHYGWGEQNISSVLKVPRHCPFVLLVSVSI